MTTEFANSTWDYENHIAIPTLDYIKMITGYNLDVLGGTPSAIDVEQRVKGLTWQARNFLFRTKENEETKKIYTYLIAFYEEYRNDFVNYVVEYIKQTFKDPDWEETPRSIIDAILGSSLKYQKFTGTIINEYYSSDLEW